MNFEIPVFLNIIILRVHVKNIALAVLEKSYNQNSINYMTKWESKLDRNRGHLHQNLPAFNHI